MNRKSFLTLALVLLLAGTVMAGGQKDEAGASAPDKIEITHFTFSAYPDHMNDLDQMIASFEEVNKDITIKVETAPYADYFTKLQTLVAGKSVPDVFELNYESFVTYAAKGVLKDLTGLAAADGTYDAALYYPKAMGAFAAGGKQYGLPETFSTVVLYYNKDLFDQAGLAYPTEDWTWADAVAAAKKIQDPEKDIWGLYSPIQFWEFYKKIAQNGGAILSEDGKRCVIDTPQNVEALQTMLDMIHAHGVMPTEADMGGVPNEAFFLSGNLGMVVSGIWMFKSFEEAAFDWDIAVEPGMSTKATHFFANAMVISADTPEAEAAWRWIRFYTGSPEMADIRIGSGWELPTLTESSYVRAYLDQSPPASRQAVFDSLKYAVVPPVIERQNELQDAVGAQLEQAVLGNITAAEALSRAKSEIEKLLK